MNAFADGTPYLQKLNADTVHTLDYLLYPLSRQMSCEASTHTHGSLDFGNPFILLDRFSDNSFVR
jgi:hypothetical protein